MIKVGTDCSGIEAPIQALKMLGLDYEHKFSCDIDKYVKQVSEGVYKPEIWYDDLMERDNTTAPEADLYVAGFPCQAFSIAGKRKGFDDIRGSVFYGVADYIRKARPKMFLLENVKGLLSHDKGKTFQTITDVLGGNGTINGQMSIPYYEDGMDYHIYYQVLNTKDYGLPQNRERIFIVGFRDFQEFTFPKTIPLQLRLRDMLEDSVDDKYYLSDKMIAGFQTHASRHQAKGNGFKFEPKNVDEDDANSITAKEGTRGYNNYIANSIRAANQNCPTDTYVQIDGHINQETQGSQVFNEDGVSPTVNAGAKGYSIGYVKTHNLAGRKGKGKDSKGRTAGNGHLTKDDGTAYALQATQGCDNAVEVKQINPSKESGGQQPYQQNRVYDPDGLAPALPAELGGDRSHNILEDDWKQLTEIRTEEAKEIRKESIKKGKDYSPRRGKELVEREDGMANAVTATQGKEQLMSNTARIRRLTPLECFRLQGFPDEFQDEVKKLGISDTQMYKMAGNSMSVPVIAALINKMI